MFLKVSERKGHKYLRIVKSYREGSKVKHKIIHNLGNLEYLLNDTILKKLLELLYKNSNNILFIDDINKDGKSKMLEYSFMVIQNIWNRYQLNDFFKTTLKKYNKRVDDKDFIKRVFSLVINRALFSEYSKLSYISNENLIGINENIDLQHLYRTLDILADIKEDIEEHIFQKRKNLFNNEIKVALYDVTTLYFESKKEDSLRKFGFSKDSKSNETQIVLGLLTDKEGFPLGFEIYEGNKSEITTLLDGLEKLKKRFNVKDITIVADRGISKALNLSEIKKRGFEYIVAVSFKNSSPIKEEILAIDSYAQISFSGDNGYYGYKEFDIKEVKKGVKVYEGYELFNDNPNKDSLIKTDKKNGSKYINMTLSIDHKIVSTYSDARAKKDASDRNRLIERLKEKIKSNQAVNKSKYLKVVDNKEQGCKLSYEIDLKQIEADRVYDGFYALASSDKSLSALEIINIHKHIYNVEFAFRNLKHTLNLRPIYHWSQKRVLGHITASFLSFALLKDLEHRIYNSKQITEYLKKSNESISIQKIIHSLKSMTLTKVNIKNETYYIKHQLDTFTSKILNLLKIKSLPNIITQKELEKIV